MRYTIISTLIMVFLITPFYGFAAESPDKGKHRLTRQLMVKSGLDLQISHTPSALMAAVAGNFKKAAVNAHKNTDKITSEINTAVTRSFRPEVIRSVIEAHIESEMAASDMVAVLKWLESPLGQRITRLEEAASTAEAYRQMAATIPILKQNRDYDERLRLMYVLDDSLKATESALERELNMQLVSMEAMSAAFPTMDLPSRESLRANFEIYKGAIRERIASEISMATLYTYRDLNLDEIKAYIDFIRTDHGIRYHDVVHEGLNKAYLFCGKKFGENMGRILAEKSRNKFNKPDLHDYPQKQ